VKPGWARALFLGTVGAGLLSIVVILDKTAYPFEAMRYRVFDYLLRTQDVAGSILVIAIAVGAWLPRTRGAATALVDFLGRQAWTVAMLVFVALCVAALRVTLNHPLAGDEHLALFQSRAFVAGHLTGQFPPELALRLVPTEYQFRWLIVSESGAVASTYWPGFALLLAPFSLIGAPWACNPLLTALSLVLMARLAARLTGAAQAGGWALLLALGSPGFTAMALSYFSMPAHLFLNLLFAWLMVQGGRGRLLAAGFIGSLALVQSNPVPHLLFALPWLLAVARESGARRNLAALAAGYAPLGLLLGVGWWLFLRSLHGRMEFLPYETETGVLERVANAVSYLALQLHIVFALPDEYILCSRAAELARLWTWSVPGLPLLALAGWWMTRGRAELRLLGWSMASTLLGYLFVNFDQGYGWGARYAHPAWGVLPILAAAAMVSVAEPAALRLRAYVLRLALLGLVFNTSLRFLQIGLFMHEHLALRPPFESGRRQIVFITPNAKLYAEDFVQNDPFLREPVMFMLSRGPARDYQEVIRPHFPGARLAHNGVTGQVWRLD
jgi:hypothetical protein